MIRLTRIRDIDPLASPKAWKILQHLETYGLPNAYMSQRFGYRLNNHRLGAAWLAGRWRDLLDEWLGPDGSVYPPSEAQARADYASGRYQQAIAASGREWWAERAALEALAEGASPARACNSAISTQASEACRIASATSGCMIEPLSRVEGPTALIIGSIPSSSYMVVIALFND